MRSLIAVALALLLSATAASAQPGQKDAKGCQDHPMFTRMPDSWIHHCSEQGFGAHDFVAADGKTKLTVEGHVWILSYYPQAAAKVKPSQLQIARNFENAITKIGGKVVTSRQGRSILQVTQDGKEIWIDLTSEFTGKHGLTIVEKQAMAQDVVADAAALTAGLKATGHVTVEGIYFDTGKSEIKPESARAIGEIAKVLAGDAALKVHVVGHTDNVGTLESNMKLSQDRAEAVVQALLRTHGIAPARLRSFGAGPYAPVSTNETDAGRAKNRRVELVKQ